MKRFLLTWLLGATLWGAGTLGVAEQTCWALDLGAVHARLKVAGLGELKDAWEQALMERKERVEALNRMEARYGEQVDAIDAIKRKGVSGLNRRDLEDRLSKARALSQELEAMQSEITSRDEQMRQLSAQIVELLDGERLRLEQRLMKGEASPDLIVTLNELSQERERYAAPPRRLDQRRYADVLRDAGDASDPDDMLAMADELLDAESQVRAQVSELESRLGELKTRRRLLRRASDFRREERFFEEGDRVNTFGSRVRGSRSERAEASEERASDETPLRDDLSASPTDVVNEEKGPTQTPVLEGDALNEQPEAGFDSNDPSRGGGFSAQDPGLSDNPAPLDMPTKQGGDPFGAPTDVVVIQRQADPNVSVGRVESGDAQLDVQIEDLESERAKLERKASALKKRAAELKRQANQLD